MSCVEIVELWKTRKNTPSPPPTPIYGTLNSTASIYWTPHSTMILTSIKWKRRERISRREWYSQKWSDLSAHLIHRQRSWMLARNNTWNKRMLSMLVVLRVCVSMVCSKVFLVFLEITALLTALEPLQQQSLWILSKLGANAESFRQVARMCRKQQQLSIALGLRGASSYSFVWQHQQHHDMWK